MDNRTPTIVLSVASGSSPNSANINASVILMPDGLSFTIYHAAAVAQSVRAFASSHAEGWVHVFESQPYSADLSC